MNTEFGVYYGNGWYVVPKEGFPRSRSCIICKRAARPGQITWVHRESCKPLAHLREVRLAHVLVIHKDCLTEALDVAPRDDYETIRNRIITGGPLFDG